MNELETLIGSLVALYPQYLNSFEFGSVKEPVFHDKVYQKVA